MKKILLIEDNATERQVMDSALRQAGWEVIHAENGEIGLERAASTRPDLILLDIILPGKNGFQICRKLKVSEDTNSIPVVLVTSKDQDADRYWGLKQGADAYLTKPVDEDLLVQTVRNLV